ncbi:MAG TPA: ribosome maturation factor RimM [Gemmatimonadaceae bacterium]
MATEYLVVGRVRRAHGLRGELVVESLTDEPDAVFAPGRRVFAGTRQGDIAPGERALRIQRSSPFKGGWIVAFDGISDRNEADAWKDLFFLLPADEVEPPADGQVFIHELVGMRVQHVDGSEVGDVAAMLELPQGLLIEVRRAGKKNALLPFNDQTVVEVDRGLRVIRVDPVEGLLD